MDDGCGMKWEGVGDGARGGEVRSSTGPPLWWSYLLLISSSGDLFARWVGRWKRAVGGRADGRAY